MMSSACLGSNLTRSSNALNMCPTTYDNLLIICGVGLLIVFCFICFAFGDKLFRKKDVKTEE
jgi:uncharacterized membrane protein SirB2